MDPKALKIAPRSPRDLGAGALIDSRYKVVKKLGTGGTSTVYEVEHVRTGQRLALKMLIDPAQAPRLEQEARATAKMTTSHVVRVVDLGTDRGTPYLVMTLLEGMSVRALLGDRKKLDLKTAANIVLQVAECLTEAHALGLVHRDLKPDNIHLRPVAKANGATGNLFDVTVLDFGVVKMPTENDEPALTRTGSTVGTPYYMSLEQLRGAATVDGKADVYSLAVLLYESFTGQIPFTASTLGDLVFAICSTPPVALQVVRPDLPRDVCDTVMTGLASKKEDRPASMRAVAKVFLPHADPAFTLWLRDEVSEEESTANDTTTSGAAPGLDTPRPAPLKVEPPKPLPRPQPPPDPSKGPMFGGAAAKLREAVARQPDVPVMHVEGDTTDDDPPTRAASLSADLAATDAARGGKPPPKPTPPKPGRDRDTPTEMFVKGVHPYANEVDDSAKFDMTGPQAPFAGQPGDPAYPTMNLDVPRLDPSDSTAVLSLPIGYPSSDDSSARPDPRAADPALAAQFAATQLPGSFPQVPPQFGGAQTNYAMVPPAQMQQQQQHGAPQNPQLGYPQQYGFQPPNQQQPQAQPAYGQNQPVALQEPPLDPVRRWLAQFRAATPSQQALVVGVIAGVSAILLVLFIFLIVR